MVAVVVVDSLFGMVRLEASRSNLRTWDDDGDDIAVMEKRLTSGLKEKVLLPYCKDNVGQDLQQEIDEHVTCLSFNHHLPSYHRRRHWERVNE